MSPVSRSSEGQAIPPCRFQTCRTRTRSTLASEKKSKDKNKDKDKVQDKNTHVETKRDAEEYNTVGFNEGGKSKKKKK